MNQLSLLQEKRFGPFFWTTLLGAFNDNFLRNAMIVMVTFKATHVMGMPATQVVPFAAGLFILPFIFFSAQAGQIADKYEKAKLIRIIKAYEIGIMIFAAVGLWLEHFPMLLAVLFFMGLQSTFYGPIKYSILPQVLAKEELVGGNALVEAATFLAILLGTLIGGVLVNLHGGTLMVGAGLIGCAVLGWAISRQVPLAEAADPGLRVSRSPLAPTIEIIRFVTTTPTIFRAIMGISWFWLFGTVMLSVLPTYCKNLLGGTESVVTLFLAVFSIGIGLGSLLCETLSRRHLELGLVPLGAFGISIFTFDLYLVGNPAIELTTVAAFFESWTGLRIVIDLLLVSMCGGFFIVPLYAFIQIRSQESHRSRIMAANNLINSAFMVLGSGLLILFFEINLTVPEIFLAVSLLNLAAALYVFLLIPEFLLRFLMWGLAHVLYRIKVSGEENVPSEGRAVIVANHVSYVDWLLLSAVVKRPIRFIMHHSFARGPMKILCKWAKIIPIASRKDNEVLMEKAFERAAYELRDDELVCIFPEGTLTWDGEMNVFKRGIERIISETPAQVIPMSIENMWGSVFSRMKGHRIKRGRKVWTRVRLNIGKPIPAKEVTAERLYDEVYTLLNGKAPTERPTS